MPSNFVTYLDYKNLHDAKSQGSKKSTAQTGLTRSQLIDTVAWILEEMIDKSFGRYSSIEEVSSPTDFHAKKLPSISIKDYLTRFATHSGCHEDAFVYALIYLDKVGETLEQFSLDSFNVHRVILICLVLACKFYDDYYYKNSYYAKIGGLKTEELNKLEQEFLVDYIQFALYVKSDLYAEYYEDLATYYQDKSLENENEAR